MKIAALFALWLLTNAVFLFVYANRESEKLLNAVVPIATASIAALIIGGFVFGGLPNRGRSLPSQLPSTNATQNACSTASGSGVATG
jgi:hypothetical protein